MTCRKIANVYQVKVQQMQLVWEVTDNGLCYKWVML